MSNNPRWKSGKRKKYQARFKAMQLPCSICGQPIDYSLPYMHPLAFCIDEKIPVSKWKQAGYNSAADAADDWNNLAPAHRRCNAMKGNKLNFDINKARGQQQAQNPPQKPKNIFISGKW